MDEQVIKYYRRLLREGFKYSGSLENPSIYLDSVGEAINICGHTEHNYLHVYINIADGKISEVKYLCVCDPTANVVAELLCSLLENRTTLDAETLTEADFTKKLGSTGQELFKRIDGVIELLKEGWLDTKLGPCRQRGV